MATTKKNQKIKETREVDYIEVEKNLTDEEKIMGEIPTTVREKIVNYESPKILYKVTNLILNNNPMTVSGQFIESFIGSNNIEARKQLKRGETTVITNGADGKEAYKLEVVE